MPTPAQGVMYAPRSLNGNHRYPIWGMMPSSVVRAVPVSFSRVYFHRFAPARTPTQSPLPSFPNVYSARSPPPTDIRASLQPSDTANEGRFVAYATAPTRSEGSADGRTSAIPLQPWRA